MEWLIITRQCYVDISKVLEKIQELKQDTLVGHVTINLRLAYGRLPLFLILGHVYTKGIRPWVLNDHNTPLFGRDHGEVHGLQPKVLWRAQALNQCKTQILAANFLQTYLEEPSQKNAYNLANIIHTCHVEFHVDFSSTRDVMGCGPKLPSCKPKLGAHNTVDQ